MTGVETLYLPAAKPILVGPNFGYGRKAGLWRGGYLPFRFNFFLHKATKSSS